MRILVVSKLPVLDRYGAEDLARLEAAGFKREAGMRASKARHERSLEQVTAALAGHDHEVALIDELSQDLVAERDLVVTVGGDGTVLATHSLLRDTPLLAVNSDPEHSLGHFTRCHAEDFPVLFAAWRDGRTRIDATFRLFVQLGAQTPGIAVLNECLVSNRNPALMSRYQLCADDRCEEHYSSGVWISTPAGSTAAIHSAGVEPRPDLAAALLYQVREPFPGRGPYQLLGGIQDPPRGLTLMATIPGMACYLDGGYRTSIDMPIGEPLIIAPCDQPLRLVAPA